MASKPLIIASLLGASIGVPYFASRSNSGGSEAPSTPWQPPANATPTGSPTAPLAAAPLATMRDNAGSMVPTNLASPSARRSPSVDQALRFDLTKDWVYRSWDRKSTGPTDVGLFAVRVALVSGTQKSSLAGALTYYFNAHDQVEHISFRGRTGDASRLIRFVTQVYEFQPAAAPPGEQLYEVTRRGRAQSELRVRPESVLSSTSAFAVELELARPGSKRFLPPHGPQLVIPQAATPAPEPIPSASSGAPANTEAAQGSGSSFLNKFRYASPQEEGQVLWKRWPN